VASMVDALKTKNVDAIVAFEPYVTIPIEDGAGDELISSAEILPDHPCCVIIARDDFIKDKKDTLKTILEIHKKATEFINANPDDAVSLLPDSIVKDPEVEKKAIKNIKFTYGLDDAYKNKVEEFMKIEIDLGLLKAAIPQDKIFQDI
jgi:NitT/TauT family transport system substrate-binding protein